MNLVLSEAGHSRDSRAGKLALVLLVQLINQRERNTKKVYFNQEGGSLSPVGKASQPSKKTAQQTSEGMVSS